MAMMAATSCVVVVLSLFSVGSTAPVDPEEELTLLGETRNNPVTAETDSVFVSGWPTSSILKQLGQVSGVGVRSDQHFFVFHRAGRKWEAKDFDNHNRFTHVKSGPITNNTILEIDGSGKLVSAAGSNRFFLPHGLTVDGEGNLWVTDVALHQVMKFPRGAKEPSLTLGERFVPGKGNAHFCKPTHVAVATTGDFFVADGYCNSRIVKFDKTGKMKHQWGRAPDDDDVLDPDELDIPHHLALVEHEDAICVADRENNRVLCYAAGLKNESQTGKPKFTIDDPSFGPVYAVAYSPKYNSLLILGGISDTVATSNVFVVDVKSGKIVDIIQYPGTAGFGYAHTMATCPTGDCVLIGGMTKECLVEERSLCAMADSGSFQLRNLWLYSLISTPASAIEEI